MGYYSDKLAAERLRTCYDLAPARVKQYLESEIAFIAEFLGHARVALELGCGYGRVLHGLPRTPLRLVGIDTSFDSLQLARRTAQPSVDVHFFQMNALHLGLVDACMDTVFCIQNGISAFGVDPVSLAREALRVTRPGGVVLFSSYTEQFWDERLAWFRLQSAAGLIGPIDAETTGRGVIACKDGFRASTFDRDAFEDLAMAVGQTCRIVEVDGSSLFCIIHKSEAVRRQTV
jgi:2-polyprenyl-6-hydroxyphenyl methylase/3-demethylubiquinone-9 3-methyltransferase